MKRFLALYSFFLIFALPVAAQNNIEINQQNKTIAVTADDTVEVDADTARVVVGYHNYGSTQDAAFKDNVRVAQEITNALAAAGVPKESIQTERIQLGRAIPDDKWSPQERQQNQFEAFQEWRIRIPASAAETVISAAVHAGANSVSDVDWDVTDHAALEAKATASALGKSKTLAQQMATALRMNLGALLHASNRAPAADWSTVNVAAIPQVKMPPPPPPALKLFPKKVRQDATVYAVFAVE